MFSDDKVETTSLGGVAGDFVRDREGLLYAIGSPVVSPIPDPASVWFFGTGIPGLMGFARRKSRSAV